MSDSVVFPDTEIDRLKAAYASQGAAGVIDLVMGYPTPEERRKLFGLSRRKVVTSASGDLDGVIAVSDAAIKDCLDASAATTDPEASKGLLDGANIHSYNLSADLAECWPGDDAPRSLRHLERGLSAAEDCLKWRHQLKKGPFPFSIAWWARGVHELSLGRSTAAVVSFHQEYHHAELVAAGADVNPDTDFGCLLARGYLAIALQEDGDPEANAAYSEVIEAFRKIAEGEPGEAANDAKFGIDQLETMKSRLLARELLSGG